MTSLRTAAPHESNSQLEFLCLDFEIFSQLDRRVSRKGRNNSVLKAFRSFELARRSHIPWGCPPLSVFPPASGLFDLALKRDLFSCLSASTTSPNFEVQEVRRDKKTCLRREKQEHLDGHGQKRGAETMRSLLAANQPQNRGEGLQRDSSPIGHVTFFDRDVLQGQRIFSCFFFFFFFLLFFSCFFFLFIVIFVECFPPE